jgi:hypothetical protein
VPPLSSSLERQHRHPLAVAQLRVHAADAAARLATDYLNGLLDQVAEGLGAVYKDGSEAILSERETVPPLPRDPQGGQPADTGPVREQPIDAFVQKWSVAQV